MPPGNHMIWYVLALWLALNVGVLIGAWWAGRRILLLERANASLMLLARSETRRKALKLRERVKTQSNGQGAVYVSEPEDHVPVFQNPN